MPETSRLVEALMALGTMPSALADRSADDSLSPGEKLQMIECVFVHDTADQWRDRSHAAVDVANLSGALGRVA